MLQGEAGIGKTSLWLAGIDMASSRGFRTLSCRTSESETTFSYVGLADLLRAVADAVLPELPPIQRRALEAALLIGESETQVDERAVAAAFLAALRLVAADGTLCLAVDDVQWLDDASLTAIRFALSRLDDEPIATLLTVRGEPPAADPAQPARDEACDGRARRPQHRRPARADPHAPRRELSAADAGQALGDVRWKPALRARARRCAPAARRALAPGEALPIPSTVDELLGERILGLGTSALEVASVVAAVGDATVDIVEGVLGDRCDAALAEALDAKILERDSAHLRFTHPLLGSAVAARQTSAFRRSLHKRLATVVPTAEERARHLALATTEPDGEIAAILEHAARSAQARGAPATAAGLAEEAHRLTPEADIGGARRRLFLAAASHHVAGDSERANVLLVGAKAEAAPGVETRLGPRPACRGAGGSAPCGSAVPRGARRVGGRRCPGSNDAPQARRPDAVG